MYVLDRPTYLAIADAGGKAVAAVAAATEQLHCGARLQNLSSTPLHGRKPASSSFGLHTFEISLSGCSEFSRSSCTQQIHLQARAALSLRTTVRPRQRSRGLHGCARRGIIGHFALVAVAAYVLSVAIETPNTSKFLSARPTSTESESRAYGVGSVCGAIACSTQYSVKGLR